MAPVTRSRAIGNIPTEAMTAYYAQRSGAGLIITEGTSPCPEGLGYPRVPGIYCKAQVTAWRNITDAVHLNGSKIFLQLMHTGRIGNVDNLPAGLQPVGPSTIKATGEIFTDSRGMQEHSVPVTLTPGEISRVIADFIKASKNAILAGFDGVELHAAGGYLLEQFLNPNVNDRTDQYGGDVENRSRFLIEIAEGISAAIGPDKTGIRFSPFSRSCGQQSYGQDEEHQTYVYLSEELDKIGIVYIHISCNPNLPEKTYQVIRKAFHHTIICSNGLTAETAEAMLQDKSADLVAFGRGFLANPDFMKRMEKNSLCHGEGSKTCPLQNGYTDNLLNNSK